MTKAVNSKAFTCKLRDNATHSKGLVTWARLASSADSRDQRLFKFMGTKGRVYTRKESNSHRIGLEHQFGRRDVMWKRSFTWLKPALSRHFYIEIGSNAHQQCVTCCPVSHFVHSPGRPASAITWKISTRDPSITILGSQLTGLVDWLGFHIIAKSVFAAFS